VPRASSTSRDLGQVLVGSVVAIAFAVMLGDAGILQAGLALLVFGFVALPISVLIHELGHALTLERRAQRGSMVIVGRGPYLRLRTGRIVVLFSVMPTATMPFGGICRYDPSGLSWRTIGTTALAGPAATAVELVSLGLATPLLWGTSPAIRIGLVLLIGWLAAVLIGSLRPRRGAAGAGASAGWLHDGDVARLAFAHHRLGTPPQTAATAVR
jgi:hypothetical protein